jgi:anti-sigma factor RsiW
MNVTREVILDLLPIYLAGEASPATRALVDEYLAGDPELAERVRVLGAEGFAPRADSALPPELELKALRRIQGRLALQRWLFGFGIMFIAFALSLEMTFNGARLTEFHFVMRDHPLGLGTLLVLGLGCFAAYFALRRREGGSGR